MKPSGKLTFSESRHQLENYLLQCVVQPENMETQECEKGVEGEEDGEGVKRKLHGLQVGERKLFKVIVINEGTEVEVEESGIRWAEKQRKDELVKHV